MRCKFIQIDLLSRQQDTTQAPSIGSVSSSGVTGIVSNMTVDVLHYGTETLITITEAELVAGKVRAERVTLAQLVAAGAVATTAGTVATTAGAVATTAGAVATTAGAVATAVGSHGAFSGSHPGRKRHGHGQPYRGVR